MDERTGSLQTAVRETPDVHILLIQLLDVKSSVGMTDALPSHVY